MEDKEAQTKVRLKMPFLKRLDKTGRIRYAQSIRTGDTVGTEYVDCKSQEEPFLYKTAKNETKWVVFTQKEMRYNKIDLFIVWTRGGFSEDKKFNAIRDEWNWSKEHKSEYEAFIHFWQILKGNLPLPKKLQPEKKFVIAVKRELSPY